MTRGAYAGLSPEDIREVEAMGGRRIDIIALMLLKALALPDPGPEPTPAPKPTKPRRVRGVSKGGK